MTARRLKPSGSVPSAAESRIPDFGSIQEEAEFWDTHDSAEYESEFRRVDAVRFVPARGAGGKRGLTVRFEEETLAEVTRKARELGIGPSTLVRMWVLERLRNSVDGPTS